MTKKSTSWGEWRAWTCEEWEDQDVFIVCDNMPALSKMPRGFWKGLYGERVVGIGRPVDEIGADPIHKGQFMRQIARSEEGAVYQAQQHGAKRVILICPKRNWFEDDTIMVVREPEQLTQLIYDTYIKEFSQTFKDKTVFITSGGPTFPWREFKDGLLNGHTVLGVNRIIALCDKFDVYFLGDSRGYWEHGHKQEIDDFKGPKYSTNLKWPRDRSLTGGHGGFQLVRIGKGMGLDERPDRMCFNRSSGGAAIDLAVHLGAKRIILLGYDMRAVDGCTNWYGEAFKDSGNPGLTFMKAKREMLNNFKRPYPKIAIEAKERGIEILNATRGSAIDCFPCVPLKDLL